MRLIDADEMAVKESEAYMSAQMKIDDPVTLGVNSAVHRKIQQLIAATPTIDAVPVTRCKDCKYMTQWADVRYCTVWDGVNSMGDDGFCNYGERSGDNNNG